MVTGRTGTPSSVCHARTRPETRVGERREALARGALVGFQLDLELPVADHQIGALGDLGRHRVVDGKGEHVVRAREPGHVTTGIVVGAVEVAEDRDDVVVGDPLAHVPQHPIQHPGVAPRRCVGPQRPVLVGDRAQDVVHGVVAPMGADVDRLGIVEDDGAHAIALVEHSPGTRRRELAPR